MTYIISCTSNKCIKLIYTTLLFYLFAYSLASVKDLFLLLLFAI